MDPIVIIGHGLRLAAIAIISAGTVLLAVGVIGAIVRASRRKR